MLKKLLLTIILLTVFAPLHTQAVEADINDFDIPEYTPPENHYYKGEVTEILEENNSDDPFIPAFDRFSQTVKVKILNGPRKDEELELSYVPGSTDGNQKLKIDEKVVLIQTEQLDQEVYYIADRYRFPAVVWLFILFFVLVVAFAGWKGLRSIIGLGFTIGVIIFFIMPKILNGSNPFAIFLIGGFIIAFFSIYLGHGFNKRTTVAVISTITTLCLSIMISILSIKWAKLFGLGTEEAFYIQTGDLSGLNLQGLLLGGIIIGVLGVLDDITTAQAATVEEIYRADQTLKFHDLVKRGMSVGHEHVISLVNTLALAYVGASFPLMLLFSQAYVPIWITLNSERVIEEIVRTLIGSSSLVIAVPITTYLAAYYFTKFGLSKKPDSSHHHH